MQSTNENSKKAARAKTHPTEHPLTIAEIELVKNIRSGFEYDGLAKSLDHVFMVAVLDSNRDVDETDKQHLFAMQQLIVLLNRCAQNDQHRKLN